MPTSAPGSNHDRRASSATGGFTLIEVLVVMAIVAVAAGLVSLALRDGERDRLERDAVRLAALFEMARAESRATSWPVVWAPVRESVDAAVVRFRFVGATEASTRPGTGGLAADRFLDSEVRVGIVSAGTAAAGIRLGPEAILPPQRVVLALGELALEVTSDGIEPFAVREPSAAAP